jgi:hypothetical protein
MSATDNHKLEDLIAEAKASGGSERANYQILIMELCAALGLPRQVAGQVGIICPAAFRWYS